jgi:uncharacterized protein YggE
LRSRFAAWWRKLEGMQHEHDKGVGATLEVSGSGRVEVAPDEAVVQLSIVTEAKTAHEAVAQNAKATQAVVDAVSAEPNHGVTTSGLGVGPITHYDPSTQTTTIVGYRATNGVSVKTKIDYAGQVYDAGIAAGANQSSGIDFRLQQEGPVREQALRLAVEDALAQARVVADAAGTQVRGVQSIAIDAGGGRFYLRSAALDAASTPTPVLPGDLTISAGVRMVLRIGG